MPHLTEAFIERLVEQFNNKTLPKVEWTHEAHIIVAFWYNWHFDFETACQMVKNRIIAYNEAVGTPNTDKSGYHETVTIFWMIWIKNYLTEHQFQSLLMGYSAFSEKYPYSKHIPFEYYTTEVLFSTKARKEWIEGDIQPIQRN